MTAWSIASPPLAEPAPSLEGLLHELVHQLWRATPAFRVAVGVSPRGDFAARPLEHGFELRVASSEHEGAASAVLACVPGELEVVEYCGAFVALCLEEGAFDPPARFVQRVGIRYVRERVHCDPGGRAALFRRTWRRIHPPQRSCPLRTPLRR